MDFKNYLTFKRQLYYWIITNFVNSFIVTFLITSKVKGLSGFYVSTFDYIIYFLVSFLIVSALSFPLLFFFKVSFFLLKEKKNYFNLLLFYLIFINLIITLSYYLFFYDNVGYSKTYLIFNITSILFFNFLMLIYSRSNKLTSKLIK